MFTYYLRNNILRTSVRSVLTTSVKILPYRPPARLIRAKSSSRRVMFFLLCRHADDGVFDDFPKISDHHPKISEDFPKLFRIPDKHSQTLSENFRQFPKMSEDFRRLPKTSEEDPKMFRWYTNEFKYNLRDELDINEIIDKLTCEIMENKPLGSRM